MGIYQFSKFTLTIVFNVKTALNIFLAKNLKRLFVVRFESERIPQAQVELVK